MKHSAKVTTVLALFAAELSDSEKFQVLSEKEKFQVLNLAAFQIEDDYDMFEDMTMHNEYKKRYYNSIMVPWCNLDTSDEEAK